MDENKKKERLRREEPERTEPFRSFANMFGGPASQKPNGAASPGAAMMDLVNHGVRLGYSVVDESIIKQSQRFAEDLRDGNFVPGNTGDQGSDILQRMVRYWADIGGLYAELFEKMAAAAPLETWMPQSEENGGNGASPVNGNSQKPVNGSAHASDEVSLSVEIDANGPVEVSLDLKPGAADRQLIAPALHAIESGAPPLTGVSFHRLNGDLANLRVAIPPGQAPDTYVGAIVDAGEKKPTGTITIRIADQVPRPAVDPSIDDSA